MASTTLYPAIVNNYTPAFVGTQCELEFSLSNFNTDLDFEGVHITVSKQSNGENIINDNDNGTRYRANKILLLNKTDIEKIEDGKYKVSILNEDIKNGWVTGSIYKLQVRLSALSFPASAADAQATWLSENASQFSEWSTVSVTKPIGAAGVSSKLDDVSTFTSSTLDFQGSFVCADSSEDLYSYTLKLYDQNNIYLDGHSTYMNKYDHPNEFLYTFKYELSDGQNYKVVLNYQTINLYESSKEYNFTVSIDSSETCDLEIYTADMVTKGNTHPHSSLSDEGNDGRIGLHLKSLSNISARSLYRIRRSDATTNFTVWEDIKEFYFTKTMSKANVNKIVFYDTTIESGVFYKYGIQKIVDDKVSPLKTIEKPVIREFTSSFLVGEDGRQLKISFNQTMNSFKYVFADSDLETIGGQFPFTARNGNLKYRSFPINGTISCQMDENEIFASRGSIFQYSSVIEDYDTYNKNHNIGLQNDYIYERFFRQEVMEFLQDGKTKLYKSPTEGNIIVRLKDISFTPNQQLGRMIYDFTSTAIEKDEYSIENCIKYKLYNIVEEV